MYEHFYFNTLFINQLKLLSYGKKSKEHSLYCISRGLFLVGKKRPVHHYYSAAYPFMRDIVSVLTPGP
jgi:hypothetical protein